MRSHRVFFNVLYFAQALDVGKDCAGHHVDFTARDFDYWIADVDTKLLAMQVH